MYKKIRRRKNSVFGHYSRSERCSYGWEIVKDDSPKMKFIFYGIPLDKLNLKLVEPNLISTADALAAKK